MKLREAVPPDVVHMVKIERTVAQHPWSLAQFLNSCHSEHERVWVLESEVGAVTGFAVSQLAAGDASLLNIAVTPGHQGQRHGAFLLQEVLRSARAAGAMRCQLEVRCSNGGAIALYHKHGFTEDGVRKNYYPTDGGREDALLMSLKLAK